MTYHPLETQAVRPVQAVDTAPACNACAATLAPDGTCLEVGECAAADASATRASRAGRTAKYSVPAAWNARGSVD